MGLRTLEDFGFIVKKSDHNPEKGNYKTIMKIAEGDYFSNMITDEKHYSYLLSAYYDGAKGKACLRLYNTKNHRIFLVYDWTEHLPYCLSDQPIESLKKNKSLLNHVGFDHLETIKKYDALNDKEILMTKVTAKDPLSIGGSSNNIRDIIPKAWEARIRYHQCYTYDLCLHMGMPYQIDEDKLIPVDFNPPENILAKINELFGNEDVHFRDYIFELIKMLQYPIPNFLRASFDIEVFSPSPSRIPDPNKADNMIIAASFADTDGKKKIFLLERSGFEKEGLDYPPDTEVMFYTEEKNLILKIFQTLRDYPIILTFNGDSFDLLYLYNRAVNLGIHRDDIPIRIGRLFTFLDHGIHVDLYRFFLNKSIQIYAFGNKYTRLTLDEVSKALLNVGKVELEKPISNLSTTELIDYCLQDAELTLQLTTFNDNLVMKLITTLMRISKMAMEDLTRQGVSRWIQNLMYFEHRRRNYLIPRSDDLLKLKGETVSEAIIKGKKFKGAIVVEPQPGIYFDTAVLDFASLYPSIIKVYNISYETVLCPHEECRDNKVPDLPHWICKKNKGLSSLIIGSLRDVRVKWYKPKAMDKSLPRNLRNLYDVIQLTLKVVLNASYGVMGAKIFNLYCPPVAEAVTAIGRYSITKTIRKAEALGIDVIYGDTDSVFLKKPTREQIKELVRWSDEDLNMELEIDKVYRYVVFSNLKKNYFGVYPDGSVDIKGLTGKKRHMPEFLKKAFIEMIETFGQVYSPEDFDEAKKKIKEIVRNSYINLKNRRYPLDEIAFNVMISKPLKEYTKTTPQHVKAARLLSESGREIKTGDIISYVKVTDNLGVKPVELADVAEVDVDKYMEYLKSTFQQVLNAIGGDFDEIMGVTKLEAFLGGYFNT